MSLEGFVLLLAGLLVLWVVLTYNALIAARNKVEEAWSGIDVQLKRRHDLVPNLVEAVRGYAAHERDLLTQVAAARSRATQAARPADVERAESGLSDALFEVRALAEAYPQLAAAENFRRLQGELSEIEDEIQAARRIYNANVQDYNTRLQLFPNLLIARPFSLHPRRFFEIELTGERAAPAVAL